ncbi:MAG: phosphate ABC transporter ATP-binding protein [candidate division WOR-3 bacterium]
MTEPKIEIDNFNLYYGTFHALKNINLKIYPNEILAVIGPANSGKSSLLRAINRLVELDGAISQGTIKIDGVKHTEIPVNELRRRIGMIFATPVVLPGTIYKNITYGPKMHNKYTRKELDELVYFSLTSAGLWEEVKDRLWDSASCLSGGQQQRLCIARTIALQPEVIMMDEPCSGLDPISTAKIEKTMLDLKEKFTFILVTNNTKQAARVSTRTAFFLNGELIEVGPTEQIFTAPKDKRTNDYIIGRFG